MSPNFMSSRTMPEKAGNALVSIARLGAAGIGNVALLFLPSGDTLDNARAEDLRKQEANIAISRLSCRVVDVAPLDTSTQ